MQFKTTKGDERDTNWKGRAEIVFVHRWQQYLCGKYKDSKTMLFFKSPEQELPARLHGGHRVITKSTAFLFSIGKEQRVGAERAHSHLE